MSSPQPPGLPPQPPGFPPQQPGPPQQPYGAPQQPYQQQPQYPPQYRPPGAPGPRKSNNQALKWILIGAGVLILCLVSFFAIGAWFVYRTVKNAGFDPDLMQRNPGLALARMATALNPDTEVVSTNESAGTITVREKSTGKVVTMKFDTEKKTLVVIGDDGKQVEFSASGDDKSGSFQIKGDGGTMRFGAAASAKAPAWVPVYPGSSMEGTLSSDSPEGSQNTFVFKSKDTASQVLTYFETEMKKEGFSVTTIVRSDQGGTLAGESADKKRTLMIAAGSSSEGTEGSITAIEKK